MQRGGYEARLVEWGDRAVDPENPHRGADAGAAVGGGASLPDQPPWPAGRLPAECLAGDEWWLRDLAGELGVGYGRFKEWVGRGYVHARRVGSRPQVLIWDDAEERERLCRLRDAFRPGQTSPDPVELTRPRARPDRGS